MLEINCRFARFRARLLCSAGAGVAAAVFGVSAAGAQVAPQEPAATAVSAADPAQVEQPASSPTANADTLGDEVVVTGTRVIRNGYDAPTPTSVIGADEIEAKAPGNIADFVNELPSLASTNTPRSNISFVSSGVIGINALNLRSLGENRTLVLLDGQRVGASTLTGLVDVNIFPQTLVKRVDVVTGGASASWGSDAVAGVVNFILDKEFSGVKGAIQGGVTTYGDNRNYNISLTAGSGFAGDRGHVLLSGELAYNDGITGIGDRDWYTGAKIFPNPAYTPTNGQPFLLSAENVGYIATAGGLINTGPLAGTYFGPGGTPLRLNQGLASSIYMQGGQWPDTDIGLTGDLEPQVTRQTAFARVSFDVSDHLEIFAQGSYGRATAENGTISYITFFRTIQPDNAFIPESIRPQVTAPFALSTFPADLGIIPGNTKRTTWRGVLGARGKFDLLGSQWNWDIYGQRSINRSYASTYIPINANFTNAIDAVSNADGVIVCRSTLTSPNNGCVPFNVFGTGVNGQAARDYISGLAWGRNRLTQNVLAATLRGDPFSTWAGPVSIAAGIEHRKEAVSGSSDPLSAVNAFWAGNYKASFGSYRVTEGFLESVVPLAKDQPFAHSLDLNLAVRATDYSTSGYVTTWKVGATYSPIEDITFRATRSRDIRAPNLSELFQTGLTESAVVIDPEQPANSPDRSPTIFLVRSGNTGLNPEKADTLGLGLVIQPRLLPGFAASVDFYNIRIEDAISAVDAQTEINQCFAGNALFCSQVTRNAAGLITSVAVSPVNFARQVARGLDFEASYRRPLLGGNVGLRVLATRYLKNYFNNGISPPIDTVGTNGFNTIAKNSLPKWRYLASLGWDRDPLTWSLTARGFSAGVQNTSYIECASGCPTSTPTNQTINDNSLPGAIYFDTSVTVKLPRRIEAYVAVDNLFNKDPAQVAYGPGLAVAPISVNPVLYDVLGRSFRVGLRFEM